MEAIRIVLYVVTLPFGLIISLLEGFLFGFEEWWECWKTWIR